MWNSLDRPVSIKNKYVSGFTTYNYKDDSDYCALYCGGGVAGDITVVQLVETDPDPTLGPLSRSVSKTLQHVVCCEMNAAARRVCWYSSRLIVLWCSHLTTHRCVTDNTGTARWQLKHRLRKSPEHSLYAEVCHLTMLARGSMVICLQHVFHATMWDQCFLIYLLQSVKQGFRGEKCQQKCQTEEKKIKKWIDPAVSWIYKDTCSVYFQYKLS